MNTSYFSRISATVMSLCAATVMVVSVHALLGHPAAGPVAAKSTTRA